MKHTITFEQSFDDGNAVYGVKIATRRALLLSSVAANVEYFYFVAKRRARNGE